MGWGGCWAQRVGGAARWGGPAAVLGFSGLGARGWGTGGGGAPHWLLAQCHKGGGRWASVQLRCGQGTDSRADGWRVWATTRVKAVSSGRAAGGAPERPPWHGRPAGGRRADARALVLQVPAGAAEPGASGAAGALQFVFLAQALARAGAHTVTAEYTEQREELAAALTKQVPWGCRGRAWVGAGLCVGLWAVCRALGCV